MQLLDSHYFQLISNNGASGDYFGTSVSIYGNYTIIGAPFKTFGTNNQQGAAYIFYFNGTLWNQQQELISNDGSYNDYFGSSVSIYGNYVIIGAYQKTIGNNEGQGAAYIFYFNGKSWIQQQELISSDGASGDGFGVSVSIYGNYSIIGALGKTIRSNSYQGAAYIFYFNGKSWTQQQELISSNGATNDFSIKIKNISSSLLYITSKSFKRSTNNSIISIN